MKKNTHQKFSEALSSKSISCLLSKSNVFTLGHFMFNSLKFNAGLQNSALKKSFAYRLLGGGMSLSFRNLIMFLILIFSGFSNAIAQTTTTFPPPDRCTSKDLELVSATLTGGDACNSCTPGTTLTRTLTLGINNKTGSNRTAFAFWGTLEITHNGVISTFPISRCSDSSPIPPTGPLPAVYIGGNFGTITYECGDALRLIDLYLAWTDASPKSTCPTLNSATISPKCGTLPSIQINVGVNGGFVNTNVICFGASTGAINLTPSGGTGPYTFSWTGPNSFSAITEDISGLVAGIYSVTITDSKNCSITKNATITQPSVGLALGTCSKTDVSCSGGDGSVTAGAVSNAVGTVHYSWKNSSNTVVGTTSSVSSLSAGTYTLTVTDDCSSKTCTVTVGAPPAISTPAATVIQPTCSTATGTVTVTSPVSGIVYTLTQAGILKYTANSSSVFSLVVPGTYTLVATNGVCSATGSVTVNSQPATPAAPSLKITQPSLCGATTGSIEVCNPVSGYTYTLVGGASIVASGLSVIFSNLAAGSNPSVTVTNTVGCTSIPANCSSATATCPAPAAKIIEKVALKETTINEETSKIGFDAFPVPFKDLLTIRYNFNYVSDVKIEVFNSQGLRVLSKTDTNSYLNKEITLDLRLNKGKEQMYIVKLTTNQGSSVKKVMSSR
jgi:SprB repeat/Secretion system C-terminal sorting domain